MNTSGKMVEGSLIRYFYPLNIYGKNSGGFEYLMQSNFKFYMDLSREENSILPAIQLMASGNVNAL
jgi:hypothetical protein